MEWINVKNKLPSTNQDIIIFYNEDCHIGFFNQDPSVFCRKIIDFCGDYTFIKCNPTHWMPLPPSPKTKSPSVEG